MAGLGKTVAALLALGSVVALSDASGRRSRAVEITGNREAVSAYDNVSITVLNKNSGQNWDPLDDAMPGALIVKGWLFGSKFTLEVERVPVVSDSYREVAIGHNFSNWEITHGDGSSAQTMRRRRAGPNGRRVNLDCFYHGHVVGTNNTRTRVTLSACEQSATIHAVVIDAPASFEITPDGNGGHLGFYLADVTDEGSEGSCGNLDDGFNGTTATATAPDQVENLDADGRERRQSCTKTVEVLIVNDESLFIREDSDTEAYSAQVFNEMAGYYSSASFNCNIVLKLVGQLTFRYGLPGSIKTRACNLRWYYNTYMWRTSNAATCCNSNSLCSDCSIGTTKCLEFTGSCSNSNAMGCYSASSGWQSCTSSGNTRRVERKYQTGNGNNCAAQSLSATEIDHSLMLDDFGDWAENNYAQLTSIFGGQIDALMIFSGLDFAGQSIGLAGVSSMCADSNRPATSVSMIRRISAAVNAYTSAHELGHNFGLDHSTMSNSIMYASAGGGWWASDSRSSFNNLVRSGTMGCLDNNFDESRGSGTCGDGIVDEGEDCDSGLGPSDSCCNSNCQFANGCVCSNTDPCCDNGQIRSTGFVCRAAVNSRCDFEETCDGVSSSCPFNDYQIAGTFCDNGNGRCHEGYCRYPLNDTDCARYNSMPFICPLSSTLSNGQSVEETCNVWCRTSTSTTSCSTSYDRLPDGTPCGDGMQCVTAINGNVQCMQSSSIEHPTAPTTTAPSEDRVPNRNPECPRLGLTQFRTAVNMSPTSSALATSTSTRVECMTACLDRVDCNAFTFDPSVDAATDSTCNLYASVEVDLSDLQAAAGITTYVYDDDCTSACPTKSQDRWKKFRFKWPSDRSTAMDTISGVGSLVACFEECLGRYGCHAATYVAKSNANGFQDCTLWPKTYFGSQLENKWARNTVNVNPCTPSCSNWEPFTKLPRTRPNNARAYVAEFTFNSNNDPAADAADCKQACLDAGDFVCQGVSFVRLTSKSAYGQCRLYTKSWTAAQVRSNFQRDYYALNEPCYE